MIKSRLYCFVDAAQQQEHQVVEPAAPQPDEEDEAEVYNPPPEEVVDDEQPIPEVINEVPNNVAPVVATTVASVLQEEAPKKSYASIVGFQKQLPQILIPFAAHALTPVHGMIKF
jgi:Ras GTPase-activating protein-binding protein 1